ncbi:MAG: hypothetical protein K2F71_06540 [Paramuribaculum sp.]|nr:hypothetical protein [Paramuribaculum sp.]
MRRQFIIRLVIAIFMALPATAALQSCGTTHGYWGLHNDYEICSDGGHHHHHGKKPKWGKKHKKHKKHKHHHHH